MKLFPNYPTYKIRSSSGFSLPTRLATNMIEKFFYLGGTISAITSQSSRQVLSGTSPNILEKTAKLFAFFAWIPATALHYSNKHRTHAFVPLTLFGFSVCMVFTKVVIHNKFSKIGGEKKDPLFTFVGKIESISKVCLNSLEYDITTNQHIENLIKNEKAITVYYKNKSYLVTTADIAQENSLSNSLKTIDGADLSDAFPNFLFFDL